MGVMWTRRGTSTLLIATITVCGWLEPAKCYARLLRRANYHRQFGGGAVIFLAHERIPRMRWRRPHTIHPAVPELQEQLCTGAIDRREFLRTVTLLGVTASAAYAMVGRLTGQPLVPRVQAAGKMGGNLRCSMRVQPMSDPATFDWGEKSNQARHILEYLTITGRDNITRPYLAEAGKPQKICVPGPSNCVRVCVGPMAICLTPTMWCIT